MICISTRLQGTFNFVLRSLIVFAVGGASLWAAESSQSVSELRVLSWNVRNYNLSNRYVDGKYRFEYPKPESEKSALRKVVADQQPDIILFQEMGGDPFLLELSEDLESEYGLTYKHYASNQATDQVRTLAVLSKTPIELVDTPLNQSRSFKYYDEPMLVKRGFLMIRVALKDEEGTEKTDVILGTYHLKSRFTSDDRDPGSNNRREKEARLLRNYLMERRAINPEECMVMFGDLNDGFGSQAYNRLSKKGAKEVMREIPVFDENGEQWTYFYHKKRVYEQIDFFFASPALITDSRVDLDAKIIGGEDVRKASDHRPILLDIQFKEQS